VPEQVARLNIHPAKIFRGAHAMEPVTSGERALSLEEKRFRQTFA
jgi:hypothetical protein